LIALLSSFQSLRTLSRAQWHAFIACFLGWALDAFDFFILVFAIKAIAADFQTTVHDVTYAISITLAMRPVGALLFGAAADRFGRRPVLMVNVLAYSVIELVSAAAPSLPMLIVLRALYGVAMGGEWGVGTALALESVPASARGLLSGFLQEGYATGYIGAALTFALVFPIFGWRGMFVVGSLPALLVLYIRSHVAESPVWEQSRQSSSLTFGARALSAIRSHGKVFLYLVVLMTAFNFFSHGTQDLYPTFLQVNRHFSPRAVGTIAVIYSVGMIVGGVVFGALSDRLGRRRSIILAAACALPLIPLWAYGSTPVMLTLGAFGLQAMVQGAWGVVPAHLSELSPDAVRGTFPGLAYQVGNLIASWNATIEADVARNHGGDYAIALVTVTVIVVVALIVIAALGPEAKGVAFGTDRPQLANSGDRWG
jgi:SHS family lactate transporter-like MFS transporter